MSSRFCQALLLSVVMFFALPAALDATLIPNACIDGVGFWDRSARVVQEWGTPVRKRRIAGPEGFVIWEYPRRSVMMFRYVKKPAPDQLIVIAVDSTDPSTQTGAGVGVGSTIKQLRAALPRLFCPGLARVCSVREYLGAYRTSFYLKHGHVDRVSIDIDSSYDDGAPFPPDPRCRRS